VFDPHLGDSAPVGSSVVGGEKAPAQTTAPAAAPQPKPEDKTAAEKPATQPGEKTDQKKPAAAAGTADKK
jgi:hypothetical protein